MSKSNGILKQRRASWLRSVLSKKEEDRQESRWKKLMTRMSRVTGKYLRTFRGRVWIGRNEPCYCGKTYAGTVLRGEYNKPILDKDGNEQEIPVKFKHCHWSTHATTDKPTPISLAENVKQEKYFKKKRRLPR